MIVMKPKKPIKPPTPPAKTTAVAIYARVSTTDQTCEQQLDALRGYVAARGWKIQGEYVETMSGAKDNRPQMLRLMEAARLRAIDCIVVWKMDRWGRSMPHFVMSVQELRTLGVRFIAITQGIDTDESSPAGRLMMNMLASFAEFERELIVERTNAGIARAKRAGVHCGPPFRVIDRTKVAALRKDGLSLRKIADKLGVSYMTVSRALAVPTGVPQAPRKRAR
jgi:putative DNA-invertase from lambdoid prophage Rac